MFPRIPALTAATLAGVLLTVSPAVAATAPAGFAPAGFAPTAPTGFAPTAIASTAPVVQAAAPALLAPAGSAPRRTVTVDPAAPAAPEAPAAPAATQWSVVPAGINGPDGRISLRHTIDPGSTATDAIAVMNLGPESATYAVAAGDGVVGDDGAFDIAAGEPHDAGAWIAIEGLQEGAVTVAPGETRVLPIRIAVPAGVTPGDHPAGIVVGVTRADDGVSVTNRVGVRLHLRVAGDIVPALEVGEVTTSFTPSWIPFAPGTLRTESLVANTGNVRLGALAGVSGTGIDAAALTGDPVEMLPGDSATIVTETSAWPLLALFGSTSVRPVAIGDDAVTAPGVLTADFVAAAPSWTGLSVIVLLAGAIAAFVVRRRRGRRADAAIAAKPPSSEDTAAREAAASADGGATSTPADDRETAAPAAARR